VKDLIRKILRESEDEFSWVHDFIHEKPPKWVRIRGGLRFKIPSTSEYKDWTITSQIHPQSEWQKVKSVEYMDGIKCYIYDFIGYKNMVTPVVDFTEEDLSFEELKPKPRDKTW
jgi:hypothetical protein